MKIQVTERDVQILKVSTWELCVEHEEEVKEELRGALR